MHKQVIATGLVVWLSIALVFCEVFNRPYRFTPVSDFGVSPARKNMAPP